MSLSFGYELGLTDNIALDNYTSTIAVWESDKVPPGKTVIVRDIGVIFTTTGGTVNFSKRSISGGLIRFTSDVTDSDENLGFVVLNEGETLALVLTSDGVGIVTVLAHSEIKDNAPMSFYKSPRGTQLFRRGGF